MSQSWVTKCQSSNSISSSKFTIKCNVPNQKKNLQFQLKSKIPSSIMYEKDPLPDDDIILTNGAEKIKIKKAKLKKKLSSISKSKFVFNSFTESHSQILFNVILQFLDSKTAINFMKSCKKYGNLFQNPNLKETNNELLIFWKYLYNQSFGCLKFRYKRRSKIRKNEQINKFKAKISNYLFWKQEYFIKYNEKYNRHSFEKIKYNNNKLTYDSIHQYPISNNVMNIITKHKCSKKKLLEIDNFVWSNWYDTDENVNDTNKYCRQYLRVDFMMQNIHINQNSFSLGFIYKINYNILNFYLNKISPLKTGDDLEKRMCKLISIYNKKHVINGIIFNRILSVDVLMSEMAKFKKTRKRLKVLVYAMEVNGQNQSLDYVVVDYFGQDLLDDDS